jgi:hypothetical protein
MQHNAAQMKARRGVIRPGSKYYPKTQKSRPGNNLPALRF